VNAADRIAYRNAQIRALERLNAADAAQVLRERLAAIVSTTSCGETGEEAEDG
jgi:hypothetical protein